MTALSPSQLVYHLGGDAFVVPVAGPGAGLVQVGTLATLPIWATIGSAAEATACARRLARQGMLGLFIGHDSPGRRWLLVVTVLPVRVTVIADDDPDALPWRRLARAARVPHGPALEAAIAFADAIDIDAAGRRTFRMLHDLLERAVVQLPTTVSRDDRHAWVLAQITRLLFLRFVESEGWLDGNPRFLATAFDRCLIAKRDPARHLLEPLFFGTLNRRWNDRSPFARAFGAVPFLNGGLFEPHALERRHRLRLPVAYWREAFAALVDRVDVTLDADADDGRVTPELLGRVFEGVMDPAERKDQGAFFTPPALVDATLRAALACHLAPKLGRSEEGIDRSLDDPDAQLRRMLLDVTVLDPAVGSGAFLVGALGLLHGPGPRRVARVRHLVTRRLFGVDRHPGAVRLCELRLWLEVLRSMRGRSPERVPPLPNLDARIRAGDALIDLLHGASIGTTTARNIGQHQRAILGAHGAVKQAAISGARRTERAAVLQALADRERSIDRTIAETIAAARAPTLFGDRSRFTPDARRELARHRKERADLRAQRRRLLRDATALPFAIASAFAPITSGRGGFDLVAGNPPWVRAERLPAATRDALAARYSWWRGGGSGWQHRPDLSVAFVERGFTLLAPGGTLAFVVPAKLATTGYATACRSALAARATLHRVADLRHDARAGFEATTYPLAVVATRRLPPAGHLVRLGLAADDPAQPQAAWRDGAPWLTAPPEAQRLLARLATAHPRLAEYVRPQLGVKTGANVAFVDPPPALSRWCRPAVRGRDVRPFAATPGAMLLWPAGPRGEPWPELPRELAVHFDGVRAQLQRRADQRRGPWWQLFRTRAATAPHRVVWRDLAPDLQAATLPVSTVVPLNSCYVAAVGSRRIAQSLAAWLNAAPIRAIARMRAEPAAGGCGRFGARAVGALPLPHAVLGHVRLEALAQRSGDPDTQAELDDCACELLGVTSQERDALLAVAAHRR